MAEAFIVRGFITDARQRPVAGVVVRAFDKDLPSLKSDQPLGDATTDAKGSYTITFGEEQFRARESGRADVYIEVRGVGDELFGRSLTRPNPGREERIDLTIEHRPEPHASEYEGLVALLAPLIEPMPLADVTAEDVAFLSKDTGAELPRIAWLAAAAWLGRHSGVRSEAFYGWARRDPAVPVEWRRVPDETEPPVRRELLLAILERLAATPRDEVVRALHASIEERIIPGEIRDEVDEIVRALVRSSLVTHQVVARLRDAETELPIAGRVVRVVDLESSGGVDEIGRDRASDDGVFVIEFGVPRGEGQATRRLRLSVVDATDHEVWSTDVHVTTGSSEVLELRVPSLRPAEPEAHALEQVVAAIRLDVPALLPLLARRNIRTLGDIRRAGGLGRIDGLPTEIDPSALHALDAHADLARVSSDVAVNAKLIGKGFAAVAEIARTPLPAFVDAVHETIGDFAAAKMHVAARAQTTFLGNVVTALALEQANGYATPMDAAGTPQAHDTLSERCGCKDCEAAVSPAAYLVDLLGYANTHLKEDGIVVAVDYLERTFHQPFGELPTDCDAVDERVRQVRLCIEVLRAYGKVHPPAAEQTATLASATRAYLVATYAMLLAKFGTSYEEVRLARTAPSEVRRALADRLGITLTEPRPDPLTTTGDELDQLFLDAAAPEVEPRALTERSLDRLFGLADTTRDVLSDGVKTGDATSPPELARWRFSGVAWARNTDSDGLVHLTVKSFVTSMLESHVEVYQDGARTKLVAAGQAKVLSGKRVVKLVTKGASGLSGSATVDALSAANTSVSVALVPKLLAWRLGNLRTTWRRQDFPLDVFAADHEPQAEQRPVIDPDVIGPDDFRRPEVAEPVFALWKTRRLWVDQRIEELAALTTIVVAGAETFTVPDVEKVLASMYAPLAYGATSITPWLAVTPAASFEALHETLQSGTNADVRAVRERIARDLNLTSEAFAQLVLTVTKHRQWLRDPKGERVPADEWDDLFSVLVRVQKARLFSAWIVEERALPVHLGPQDFWRSEREPGEGAWPPPRTGGRPLIDPDDVKLTDLPEPTIGKTAIQIWHARRAALVAETAAIKTERETNGFDAMLRRTLGHPASGDPLQYDLATVKSDLISSEPATVAAAIEKVVRDLHLTVEAFHRLMAMKEQAAPASPRPPRAAEWIDLYATLLGAHKRKHLYPLWSAEENAAGLTVEYWRACKAQLPRARVLPEERATWRDGLALRSRPALIDPDRIDITELDVVAEPAFKIWEARRDRINDAIASMDAEPKTLAGFDSIVSAKLSVAVDDLIALDERRKAGEAIQARLDQLHLTNAAFVHLLAIRALLAAGQPVLPEEWAAVHSILVQVAKHRLSAAWREEERLSGITLSPDFFVPPPPLPARPVEAAAAWRFDQEERFEWLDKLTARVEQERSTLGGFHEVVSDVEASALPSLRDALVSAVGVGADLSTKATWVAERLLIDAKTDGCQKTTRIAQAIETIQGLLFGARTSQSSALQTLRLTLDAPDFDEEWRWIGSYATWRAAMFVYMYPENIAVGSLRRRQTPAFQALVKSLRQTRRLTSEQACAFAHEYATYYEDIARLVIGGTVQALVTRRSGTRCVPGAVVKKPLVLIVGRGGVSNRLYWSTFDPADTSGHAQSFWDYVPGVVVVANVVGVALYERSSTERRAFVFIRTTDDKLSFLTFDLESGRWDGPVELALPPGDPRSLDIAVDQNTFFYHPPRVALRAGGDIYFRSLNPEGSGWQDGDWSWFRLKPNDLNLAGIDRLFAVTEGRLWVRKGSYITVRDVWVQPGSYIVFEQLPPGAGDHGAEYIGAVYWGKEKGAWYRWLVQQRTDGQVVARSDVSFPSDISAGFRLQGLRRVAPNSGHVDHASFAYERRNVFKALGKSSREQDGVYLRLVDLDPSPAIRSVSHRIAPRVIPSAVGQFSIPARVEGVAADVRRNTVRMILAATSDSATNRAYAEEAYFFVPMMLSDALRQAGEYVAALDWARTVFDYASPPSKQKIYYGLVQEESLAEVYKRSAEWLSDPLDPHAIAASRRLTYTRFTLLAIVRLLLDYADDEFTADTAETVPRARRLYQTALEVLDLPELRQQLDRCDDVIGTIELALGPDAPPRATAILPSLTTELARVGSAAALRTLVPKVKEALTANESWDERLARARSLVEEAAAAAPASPTVARALAGGAEARARAESVLLSSEVVVQAAAVVGRTMSARFRDTVAADTGIAPATLEAERLDLPWLRRRQLAATPRAIDFAFSPDLRPIAPKDSPSVVGLFRPPVGQRSVVDPHIPSPVTPSHPIKPPVFPSLAFCVPPNPMLAAFRTHAELNLLKIRTCRNIAGMKRELDPYVAPIDTVSGLPTIGAGGRLALPGASVLRPTLYRYAVLVQRAKELIATAQQIEASMLSAFEKRDAEAYSMMRARQDLELAKAGLALEVLQVKQANDGVGLAALQQARAQIQLDHYERLLDEGMIELERGALETLAEAALLQAQAATANFTAALLYAGPALGQIVAGAIVGAAGGPAGAALGALAGAAQAASGIAQALTAYASGASSNAAKRSTRAQISLTLASFERRRQEWELSSSLARQDVAIGAQQLTLATDTVDIAKQQKAIAEARNSQAKDTVTFLANKFTNAELYDWMSDVLEDVYGFFLQQATSTARLAENQLAFERQEALAAFIQGDYWQGPDDRALVNPTENAAVDRRGLTGSARLLQDVHRLDQYAFTTDRRKLQLSKTISLALMAPVEFQRFRETGVMTFATPMSMFDRDFPGHYLRLIRSVRASVVALVPPTEGIHATLSTPGISRVVIGPDIFQTMPIRRDPELVALTSPTSSNGVFELEPQDKGMLRPFEGSGVDTSFELRMPKAANFFDYFTIADVLVTIEYTALQSIDYAQQVIPMLRGSVSGDRPLSFRNQLADPWYDLHNPDQTSDPMVVKFRMTAMDFPPNLKSLRIEHVALYFMRANGASFEVPVSRLRFTEDGRPGAVGGGATSIDGIISTRRGNAGSWTAFVGKTPVGEWELALPDTEETRRRFASAEIEDILFVVTYSGRTHDWPAN